MSHKVTYPFGSGVKRFWWIHVRMIAAGSRMPAFAHSPLICFGVPFIRLGKTIKQPAGNMYHREMSSVRDNE